MLSKQLENAPFHLKGTMNHELQTTEANMKTEPVPLFVQLAFILISICRNDFA